MEKIKLVESFSIDFGKSKLQETVEFLEKPKLVEDSAHKQFEARAIIRDIPVSRYTPNHNGRIYPQKLWSKVKDSGLAEGSDCYGNHSEDDDGNVFDTVGVWRNLRIGENFPIADLYCIGEGGQLLAEKVRAGGKAGFSSVGYGEFLEDKMTVNPDTFELCHLCDWVVSPSQEVYATYENIKDDIDPLIKAEMSTPKYILDDINKKSKENKQFEQNIEKSDQLLKEDITNKITEKVENSNIEKEQIKEVKFMEKFQEANIKNHVNEAIRKALKNSDISEAIQSLKELDTGEIEQLTEKVDNTITTLQNKLDEQKEKAENALKEKEALLSDIQKKYEESEKKMVELKKNYERVSKAFEKIIKEQDVEDQSVTSLDDADANNLGKENYADVEAKSVTFTATDSNPQGMKITTLPPNQVVKDKGEDGDKLGAEASAIVENTKKLKETKLRLEEEISRLKEDRENMKSDIKALLEDRKLMISDIKQLIKDRKAMREDIKTLQEQNKVLKKKIKEEENASEEVKPDEEDKVEEAENDMEDNRSTESYEFSFTDDNSEEVDIEEEIEEPIVDEFSTEEEIEEPIDYMDAEKQVEEAEEEMNGQPEEVFDNILTNTDEDETLEKPMAEEDEEEFEFEEEELNMSDEEEKEEKKEEKKIVKKQPVLKENTVKAQVKEYFEAEVKFNSSLKDIKEKILESKSLSEAVIKINKFKESIKNKKSETPIKLSESSKAKPSWLGNRL